ncbi:MAG: acyl-CoA thioesterase II [Myxococcota bacterium]|nr:acyl-CoA thioesterase II [Myxococcales bacterium]
MTAVPDPALSELLGRLELERLEQNLFRGTSPPAHNGRIFGGLVLAQGLRAAFHTVEAERSAHSLHAYFLRPGDPERPILYEVDRIRDGRSFTTRRVVAIQKGEAILNMAVSFMSDEDGFEHQIDVDVPAEVSGEVYEEGMRRGLRAIGIQVPDGFPKPQAVEILTVGELRLFDEQRYEPTMATWLRSRGPLGDDPALHQCVLAYASDLAVMVPAIHPHDVGMMSPGIHTASLDHAMWFHRPLRVDDWLYVVHESPVSARARGFGRATFYTREGVLVASCTQEGLIRRNAVNPNRRGR